MKSFHIGAKRSAFTLIELLVVIAIIAILASILFPVFGRARENARRSSCQSNLKQIGLGIMQYTQDYDERFPLRWYGPLTGAPRFVNSWRRSIFPYVKSTQLFSCPSNTKNSTPAQDSTPTNMTDAGLPAGSPVFNISYAINAANSFPGTPPSEHARGASLSEIVMTSECILVTEMTQALPFTGDLPSTADWGNPEYVFKGHLGMVNFLFCDGHVKSMKMLATATPKNLWSGEDDAEIATTHTGWARINNWNALVEKS
jgi:prepilin-type N-terminal cleavage/methylation domain-containing protein/prepilin-type processing-associated H-X9-DG protein